MWSVVMGDTRVHLLEGLVAGYLEEAGRLQELDRIDEAETILREAAKWFPDHPELLINYARLTERRQDWAQAEARWHDIRTRYPERWHGYIGEALALCHLDGLDEAEALLSEAMDKFPDEPQPILDHARIASLRRDWGQALSRWHSARGRFPERSTNYIGEAWALRELGRLDEAETLLRETLERFPDEAQAVVDYARIAEARKDWPEAVCRWEEARRRCPADIACFAGGAVAFRGVQQFDEAEALVREAMERFPPNAHVWFIYADLATQRKDWPEALERWNEVARRFPSEEEAPHRIFEAKLRLLETVSPTAIASHQPTLAGGTDETRQLLMDFESLGGMRLGCEFGLVQRHFGAEPLGLLRWTAVELEELVAALDAGFAGVGLPENTRLSVEAGEYVTRDTRFGLRMHTFIRDGDITTGAMLAQSCRRLQFLTRKMLDDLARADKIFVFKLETRTLAQTDIHALHKALSNYGENALLYVRYFDSEHPAGSVCIDKPGVFIGYIDHFGYTPEAEKLELAINDWVSICRDTHDLWRKERARVGRADDGTAGRS